MTISPLSAPRAQQLSPRPPAATRQTTIDWLGEMYLYVQLAEILRNQIRSGELPPGRTLPPIRQLATQHKIAKRTVRQGIAILEEEHLVEVMPRQGFRVLEHPPR